MASITHGAVAHVYGVGVTITNAAVQNFSIKKAAANKGEVINEEGNVIERRSDDITQEVTFDLVYAAAYTEPTVGSVVTLDAIKYEVTSVDNKQTAKGFSTYSVSAVTSQYITLS